MKEGMFVEYFTIVINREIVEQYDKEYFKKNPRSRKSWFKNNWKNKGIKNVKYLYGVLSLNDLLPIDSMAYSNLKKKWGDFGLWLANYYGISNKNYKNAVVEYRVFSETRAKKDIDNLIGASKIVNDCLFVKSGAFEDDNYTLLNPFLGIAEYDKENPRTEIRISILDENIKEPYMKAKIHINNFEGEQ